MNQYSQLLYFLKQLAEAHPMVNTVTKGLAENIDLEKANIFPLVHITIDEAGFKNGQTIGFNVTLECLTERLLNKKVVDNKFWRQDNEVDNHNETLAILNYMWTSIFRDWNKNNMTTSDEPTLNKIEFAKGNILDGWAMTFEVEVPNTALTLCDITFDDIEAVISAGTGGTVKPAVGTFALTYGTNNAYYAEASDNYTFSKWLFNGIETLINPIIIRAVENYTLAAQFIASGITTILKTFHTAPVKRGGSYYFGDYSGQDNDSEVGSVRVGTFGTSQYINTSVYNVGGEPIDLTIEFNVITLASLKRTLYRSAGAAGKGLNIVIETNGYLQIILYSGANQLVWNTPLYYQLGINTLRITWDGQTGGTMTAYLNTQNWPIQTTTDSGTFAWSGNSTEVIKIGYTSSSINSFVSRVTLLNKFDWIINHGQGSVIYDISGNGNNGTINGAVLSTFWGSTANSIEPYDLTKGATLYQVKTPNYLTNDLIVNGGFNTDTVWVKGSGWTISGGKANCDGNVTGSNLTQPGILILNSKYEVEFDLTITSGAASVILGATGSAGIYTTSGHYKCYGTCLTNNTFYINAAIGSILSIDNVVVKEIDAIPVGVEGSIMPICMDTMQEISSYTRLGWFPAGYGILKGLPNKYNLVGNSEVPQGDYTADEIALFNNTDIVEVTQNANAVTQLILKQ